MSKFFDDVINSFQRKVYCIFTPCLILLQCLQTGSLSEHALDQLLSLGKPYEISPMLCFVLHIFLVGTVLCHIFGFNSFTCAS